MMELAPVVMAVDAEITAVLSKLDGLLGLGGCYRLRSLD